VETAGAKEQVYRPMSRYSSFLVICLPSFEEALIEMLQKKIKSAAAGIITSISVRPFTKFNMISY
jgi:hypothetical protein